MVDAATGVAEDGGPRPGNITICFACGHIMAFTSDMTLRELTGEEMRLVAGSPELIAVQKLRRMRRED
jgi:hypothetical protein